MAARGPDRSANRRANFIEPLHHRNPSKKSDAENELQLHPATIEKSPRAPIDLTTKLNAKFTLILDH